MSNGSQCLLNRFVRSQLQLKKPVCRFCLFSAPRWLLPLYQPTSIFQLARHGKRFTGGCRADNHRIRGICIGANGGSGIISSLLLVLFCDGTPWTMGWITALFTVASALMALTVQLKNKTSFLIQNDTSVSTEQMNICHQRKNKRKAE